MSEAALLERPIIVIGAPRSGTTMLSNVLSLHSSLGYVDEPRLVWRWKNDAKSDMLRPEDARPEVVAYIHAAFAKQVHEQGRTRLLEKTPSNALRMGFVDRVFPDAIYLHILRDGRDSVLGIRD